MPSETFVADMMLRYKSVCSSKLVEESHIVLREESQVFDAVFEVGDTLNAHAEGKTAVFF